MSRLRLVTLSDGTTRLMSADEVKMQRARSKGGREAARRGTRYCWTSEQARAAALKAWSTRWRRLRYSGVRAGRPRHQRPPVNHAKLRTYYAKHSTLGIHYDTRKKRWFQVAEPYRDLRFIVETDIQCISERTALIRLGHLPPPRRRGPVPIDDGIEIATTRKP